jgi:hypothetical protein
MLGDELGAVVDLIMHNDVDVLLSIVLCNFGISPGRFLFDHGDYWLRKGVRASRS